MIVLNTSYSRMYGEKQTREEDAIIQAVRNMQGHALFGHLDALVYFKQGKVASQKGAAVTSRGCSIYVNKGVFFTVGEWEHMIAHCMMHTYFGHYDKDKMPDEEKVNQRLWNKACDIYVERFLRDVSFGQPASEDPAKKYRFKLDDEQKIYYKLMELGDDGEIQEYGTAGLQQMDMLGLNNPATYRDGQESPHVARFASTLANLAASAVGSSGGHVWDESKDNAIYRAARWFISHYPLLGSIASSFEIVDDYMVCMNYDVQTAAVDSWSGIIYANPTGNLQEEEWKFVLAHEYLHAGLQHHARCQGRDGYIWNLATDYVINGWLKEMGIGIMPSGCLYDEGFKNMSAESVYDILIRDIRRSYRLQTFRGYHKGDLMGGTVASFSSPSDELSKDDFYKTSLSQGLEYHQAYGRGTVPSGLVQEIRALMMPPIDWRVELAEWFTEHFPLEEKHRSYARPSRRQSATPDIPRPGWHDRESMKNRRTFGVIIDTSGSMSASEIGKALGAVASYALSREVRFVRVVFCDAEAYDCGFMAAEDIAGRVEVKGRGGTVLQPAVSLLEEAYDFPKAAPILIITDGMIESHIRIRRDHAWLLSKHHKLPFATRHPIFEFE